MKMLFCRPGCHSNGTAESAPFNYIRVTGVLLARKGWQSERMVKVNPSVVACLLQILISDSVDSGGEAYGEYVYMLDGDRKRTIDRSLFSYLKRRKEEENQNGVEIRIIKSYPDG